MPPNYSSGFTQFEFEGTVYFAIGCFGSGDGVGGNDLFLFDSSTNTWYK